ncbi:hypothetical protein V6N13_064016 [Hibiscus sabdariffa]
MLSAVICSALGYPAFTVGTITGIPQITKADFRHCSTGISCSQAPFYLYTQGPIFARPEETFACLRYLLGGASSLHLHRHVYFTESTSETVPKFYAFRAGQNLPDKEFRYLRTAIVTVTVHRGLTRRLPSHQVTNFLDLPALGKCQPP